MWIDIKKNIIKNVTIFYSIVKINLAGKIFNFSLKFNYKFLWIKYTFIFLS